MTRSEYIEAIAKYVRKYCKEYGVKVASPIIAQAIVEGLYWNNETNRSEESILARKYHNYFGMKCGTEWKGGSVNLDTYEEYTVGTMTLIQDNFRTYPDMESGVKGYFDFIQYPRYKNLFTTNDPYTYICRLKEDGYATASAYVDLLWKIVQSENLTRFDDLGSEASVPEKSNDQIVRVANKKPKGFSTSVYGDYVVNVDNLEVKNGAGKNAKLLTTIPKHTPVMCSGFYTEYKGEKWLFIQFYGTDSNVYLGFANVRNLLR